MAGESYERLQLAIQDFINARWNNDWSNERHHHQ